MAAKKISIAAVAVLVVISAIYDFYRGYSHEKSITEGSLSVIFGFIVVACFWWLFTKENSN